MSVDTVRSQISDMLRDIRIQGCIPTMRSALMLWSDYLDQTQPNGLSAADKQAYAEERKRVAFLLTDVFPETEVVSE